MRIKEPTGLHRTRARKLRQETRLFWAQKFSSCCWGHGGSSCEKWLFVELLLWLLLPCSILNLIWLKKKIQSSLPTDEASWMKGGGKLIADEACQGCCLSWSQIKWNWAIFFCSKQAACYNVQQTVMFRAFPAQVTWLLYSSCFWSTRLSLTLSTKSLLSRILHVFSSERDKIGGKGLGSWSWASLHYPVEIFLFPSISSVFMSPSFLLKCKASSSRMLAPRLMSCKLRVPPVKWWLGGACCYGHIQGRRRLQHPWLP